MPEHTVHGLVFVAVQMLPQVGEEMQNNTLMVAGVSAL